MVFPAPAGLRVVVEITERALATRPADLLRAVERVREVGWGVALDDVGAAGDPCPRAVERARHRQVVGVEDADDVAGAVDQAVQAVGAAR